MNAEKEHDSWKHLPKKCNIVLNESKQENALKLFTCLFNGFPDLTFFTHCFKYDHSFMIHPQLTLNNCYI
jgi:hypothetical protein